jgi:hypothetical protein
MKKKVLSLILALVLAFSLSGLAYASGGVNEPGVAGIFIDAIENITLNPAELADMQQNGLEIPVNGYAQYISSDTGGQNPRLSELLVKGQNWDAGLAAWTDDATLIDWASMPLLSTPAPRSRRGSRPWAQSSYRRRRQRKAVTANPALSMQ